jgi:hypothetical protein
MGVTVNSLGRIGVAVVVVAIALPARGPAHAAPSTEEAKAQARALLVAGSKHLQAGEYAEALARFEKAYELVPSPKIQYNFGLAYVGLDRPSDALRAFEVFIADAGDANAADIARAREYLGRLSKRVAVLQLEGDLGGTEVSVDGKSFGPTARVFVDPGLHLLTVERKGETPFLQRVTVAAGQREKIEVKFAPQVRVAESPPPVAPPREIPRPREVDPPARDRPPPPPPERTWQKPTAYASAAMAGVLLAGGIGTQLVANGKYTEFNNRKIPGTTIEQCARMKDDKGGKECQELLAAGDRWSRLALIGFIGAGAAAVTSVILFVTAPSGSPEVSLACGPDVGLRGARCQLRF